MHQSEHHYRAIQSEIIYFGIAKTSLHAAHTAELLCIILSSKTFETERNYNICAEHNSKDDHELDHSRTGIIVAHTINRLIHIIE